MSNAAPDETEPDSGTEPTYTGMPTWVKWFVVAAFVLAVVVVVALLVGGEHGPGRHMSLAAHMASTTSPCEAPGQSS